MRRIHSLIMILVLLPTIIYGQKLQPEKASSSIQILGTSSLHDWESEAQSFDLSVVQKENLLTELNGSIQVKSIKSGKSIMDEKTYDALGADKFPDIKFQANQLEINDGKVLGTISLTIKDVTKEFEISATSTMSGGNIKVTGEVPLDMTSFNVEPPTAMFGTLTTGKDIKIKYHITLKSI
jgi:polyisoprenoid-binding protein YceI